METNLNNHHQILKQQHSQILALTQQCHKQEQQIVLLQNSLDHLWSVVEELQTKNDLK